MIINIKNQFTNQNDIANLAMLHAKLIPEDFEDDFQKIVVDYRCPICNGIYVDPVVDLDGNSFCYNCLTNNNISGSYIENNNCLIKEERNYVSTTVSPLNVTRIKFLKEILDKKIVKCKNRSNNCEWKGMLMDLVNHMQYECKKHLIPCNNDGCKQNIFREDMNKHLQICPFRIVDCEFCNTSIASILLPQHHEVCPKYVMSCPQKCGSKITREDEDNHIFKDCLNTLMNCPLSSIGCLATFQKKNFHSHMEVMLKEHEMFIFCFSIKRDQSLLNFKETILARLQRIEKTLDISQSENLLSEDDENLKNHTELLEAFGVANLMSNNDFQPAVKNGNANGLLINLPNEIAADYLLSSNTEISALQSLNRQIGYAEQILADKKNKSKNSSKRSSQKELDTCESYESILNPMLDLNSDEKMNGYIIASEDKTLDKKSLNESESNSLNDEKLNNKRKNSRESDKNTDALDV